MSSSETKISHLEQSIQFIKQRLKAQQLSKDSLEERLRVYESQFGLMHQERTNRKANIENSFEDSLGKSIVLRDYLKKSDTNAINNMKKIEEYLNGTLETMEHKFSVVENSLIGLISRQEKVIEHISYQVENQAVNIRALDQWVKVNQGQNRSLTVYEDNMNIRQDTLAREFDFKMKACHEEISLARMQREQFGKQMRSLQQKTGGKPVDQSSAGLGLERRHEKVDGQVEAIHQKLEDLNRQVIRLNRNQKKEVSQPEHTLRKSEKKSSSFGDRNYQELAERLDNFQSLLNEDRKNLNKKAKEMDIKKCQREIQELKDKIIDITERMDAIEESNLRNQTDGIPLSNPKREYSELVFGGRRQLDHPKSAVQKRPNQKINFESHKKEITEQDMSSMRGGIRGLLQKSKERQDSISPLGRNRRQLGTVNPLKKPLPPKKNSLLPLQSDMMQPQKKRQIYEEQSSNDEAYQIDEDGFLIDSEGNYLTNEYGERMQLSSEQINQILRQQGDL